MTTTERIKKLIYDSGKSDYAIKKETGLGNSVLSDLKAGRAENPSVKTIKILAEYFNVSADYLLCLTDTPTPLNIEQTKKAVPVERLESNTTLLSNEDLKTLLENNDGVVWIEKLYNELKDKQQRMYVLTWLIAYMASEGLPVKQILGK